jgi:hypothetical protein
MSQTHRATLKKTLLDVVKGWLVVDDSPRHVVLAVRQEQTKPAERGVTVRIAELHEQTLNTTRIRA